MTINLHKLIEMTALHTWDPGLGVLHFLMLQTVLNEKLTLPHFGHFQSLSRVASVWRSMNGKKIRKKKLPFSKKEDINYL